MSNSQLTQRVEPAFKQIYEDDRDGTLYQILYVDGEVVLFRSEDSGRNNRNGHRIERRSHFDSQVESGRFTYRPDSDVDMTDFQKEQWSDVSHIGEKTQQNLYEEGIETVLDLRQADDSRLLMVDGVGAVGLENLREFAR